MSKLNKIRIQKKEIRWGIDINFKNIDDFVRISEKYLKTPYGTPRHYRLVILGISDQQMNSWNNHPTNAERYIICQRIKWYSEILLANLERKMILDQVSGKYVGAHQFLLKCYKPKFYLPEYRKDIKMDDKQPINITFKNTSSLKIFDKKKRLNNDT